MAAAPVLQSRAALESAQQNREHLARVNAALEQIYATRFSTAKGPRLIRPSEAARIAIIRMCAEYSRRNGVPVSESECVPSVEILEEINRPGTPNALYFRQVFTESMWMTVQQAREEEIAEILMTLVACRPSIDQYELNAERSRLANGFTLQSLRNRLKYLKEALRLSRKTLPEIKQELANVRAAAQPLPDELPYSPEELRKKLATCSRLEQERLVSRFGWERLNARIQRRDGWVAQEVSQ